MEGKFPVNKSRRHLTSSMLLATGYVAQIGFQMIYFLVLIRMLGPEVFGHFAAALAAITLASPLAGLGYTEVALVRVSQRPREAGLWAVNAIVVTAIMGTLVAVGLAGGFGLQSSGNWLHWKCVLGLGLTELVLVRCCNAIARVEQASGYIFRTALNHALIAAMRAGVAGVLYGSGFRSLELLIMALMIALAPIALGFYVVLARRAGPMAFSWQRLRDEFGLAFSFSTGMASQVIYTDLDKLFLARWTTPYVVGTYTAGYKILTLAFMPIRAVLEATIARKLQLGLRQPRECIRFTIKLYGATVSLAIVIAVCLFVLAPYATLVLGAEFEDSIAILRIGFLLPVIQTTHCVLSNYLTAIGRQPYRTSAQIITLLVYVVAGWFFIRNYSWLGAIYCSLACETLLAVLFGIGCIYFSRRLITPPDWVRPGNAVSLNSEPVA